MAHQSQLENRKYRSWVKAGLGLKYAKEGLEPFCDQLVKQLHVDVLKKVKQKHNLSAVTCGSCDIKTLQPDHVRTRSKQCPLGQTNCNCQNPRGKNFCSVCGAIYDEIIKLHASTPPSPYWKNTDAKYWCTEPWSVAKCFINAAGYEKKLKASEFDCSGLLHILLNNMDFRDHLNCTTDGTDLLQKVLHHRNLIYHSHSMELEDVDVTSYLDDMIALLQDGKELINTKHSKSAVVKLVELKREDFVITTTNETEICRAVIADVNRIKEEQKRELEKKGKEESDQIVKTGNKQKTDLNQKEIDIKESIKDTVTKGKTDLTEKGDQVRDQIIGIGTKQKTDLNQKEIDIKKSIKDAETKGKTDLTKKGDQVRDQIIGIGTKQKTDLNQKEIDIMKSIKDAVTKGKTDLTKKMNQIVRIVTKQKTDLNQKKIDIMKSIKDEVTKGKTGLTEKGDQVRDQIVRIGTKQKTDLNQKEIDIKEGIKDAVTKGKTDLTEKGDHIRNLIVGIGTKQETDIDRREVDITENIEDLLTIGKSDLADQGNQVKDEILSTGTNEKVKRDTTIETGQTQHDLDYNHKKTRFQKKLVDNYMQYVLKVSSLPLQPEINRTEIANMYASPWMTVEVWDEKSKQTKEVEMTLDEIFSNEETMSKYIYILGEAGSGKSALCKYLVNYWCLAHCELTTSTIMSESVKEMEKYDFLFYISLRHYSKCDTVENMLDEIYHNPILRTILQNESDKCLVLLDGLDEWTPQNQRTSQFMTKGLPARDINAEYTIITTTRRWKFDSLQITDSEIHKKIQLKGITEIAIKDLTKTTVKQLNEIFHKRKDANDFEPDLKRSPVADLSHVPMILQQLICLWFDGKLQGTSKCSVYSSMLDLFFDWKSLKHSGSRVLRSFEHETDSRLPEYLCEYKACCDNTNIIYYLARLAYKTLFNRDTKDTLTFSNSTFHQLKIPDDEIMRCLNAGILSEDLNVSLVASTRPHSSFSFVHKSMQEFLAAVHIAMQFEKTINISNASRKGGDNSEENCKQFIRSYFRDCKTVVDILEQSNVFIMLCGLEPKLLPYISEYIFNITKVDENMMEERNILQDDVLLHEIALKESIQKCIISCIKEASLEESFPKNSIYIADIVLGLTDDLIPYLRRQIFNLHSVVSLDIKLSRSYSDTDREHTVQSMTAALNLVTDIECLKAFKCYISESSSKQLDEQVAQIISRNKKTLECVSCITASKQNVIFLVQIMPALTHLISIKIYLLRTRMSHAICTSLCTHLKQSVHLQYIRLNVDCLESDKHFTNLAKHKQLQYLHTRFNSIYVTSLNTNSLHTCKVHVSSSVMINQLSKSLYNARKLKCLSLCGSSIWLNNTAGDKSDTKHLIRLLPTLTSLSTVELLCFTITDNIITRPADMKNLKEIRLSDVTMKMTTWFNFVDSLTKLPQAVHVYSSYLKIRDTTRSIVNFSEEARRYVRERTDSFSVTRDNVSSFEFVSRKREL